MKQLADKIGLIHTIRRVTFIIYGIMVICFYLIGIYDRASFLKNEIENIRNDYTEEQKLIVKTQVQSAV